jgi:small GTP-binding protein
MLIFYKNYRFLNGKTTKSSVSTVGIPHSFRIFQLTDGSLVNVTIIDTAGQEKYRSLTTQYYKGANGILLVYDISNKKSFDEINYYSGKIKENCDDNVKIILLGNKTDLEEQRQIEPEVGAEYAAERGYMFMETSCFTNTNVADCFETLIELTYREVILVQKEKGIVINNNNQRDNYCYC